MSNAYITIGKGVTPYLNMSLGNLRSLGLGTHCYGVRWHVPAKTIFKWCNLAHFGVSSDIFNEDYSIIDLIFLRKNNIFYGRDNGNNYFRC